MMLSRANEEPSRQEIFTYFTRGTIASVNNRFGLHGDSLKAVLLRFSISYGNVLIDNGSSFWKKQA